MELRHLRYFTATAEERHFGRAAQRLHIAQPPLSRQIQALEAELGVELFDRSRRQIELTHAGQVFLEHSRRIFSALEHATSETRRASRGETGRVVVGYPSSFAHSGLTELIRTHKRRFPGVAVVLREMALQEQLDALESHDIDVAFVRPPVVDPKFASECVRKEALMVALPVDHPLAHRKQIPLKVLSQETFVSLSRARAPAFFDMVTRLCHDAGFTPRLIHEAPQLDVVGLVAAGMGVAVVPEGLSHYPREDVVFMPIVGNPMTSLLMVHRVEDDSPTVLQFLEVARELKKSRAVAAAG